MVSAAIAFNGQPVPKAARFGNAITAETTVTASVVSTTETVICSLGTLPANYFLAGKGMGLRVIGRQTGSGVGGPSLRLKLRYGGTGINGTVLLDSNTLPVDASAITDGLWFVEAYIQGVTVGSSGTVWPSGIVGYPAAALAASIGIRGWGAQGTAGAQTNAAVSIDTTVSAGLYLTGTWSANTAGNSFTGGPGALMLDL